MGGRKKTAGRKKAGKKEKTPELSFLEKMSRIEKAGISGVKSPVSEPLTGGGEETLPDLHDRIRHVLGIFKQANTKKEHMIYFIMYDIERNKIRNYIAKYLERKGCIRIQKSVFIAESERKRFDEIQETLRKVQEKYENSDSIFLIPVSADHVRAMKIIGQSIDFDLVLERKNTMFF